MSFRTRLTLLTAAAITITLVVASIAIYSLAHQDAFRQIDEALDNRITFIRFALENERTNGGGPEQETPPGCQPRTGPRIPGVGPGAAGGFSRVLDRNGEEVDTRPAPCRPEGSAPPEPMDESELPESVRNEFRQSRVQLPISAAAMARAKSDSRSILRETINTDEFHFRVYTARIDDEYTVQVARPIDETQRFLEHLQWLLIGVTVSGLALSVIAALIVTGAASRPVHELTELAIAVRESGDLSQRVAAEGNDDLARLARSFNAMLEELERSVRSQLRLVDDASHQMRTPLASIRTNMDVLMRAKQLDGDMVREIMGDLSAQVDELTGLVRDLVDLASGVESTLERGPVRLEAVAEEAIRLVRGAFPALRFETRLEHSVVHGSEERLVRMTQNLLHNACKWSPAGGVVEVCVDGEELRVIDHGPGVAEDERARIFERFHRAADARDVPGSGLGLAIVHQIVVDHGGSIRVEETPGGGATFVAWLPRDEELLD